MVLNSFVEEFFLLNKYGPQEEFDAILDENDAACPEYWAEMLDNIAENAEALPDNMAVESYSLQQDQEQDITPEQLGEECFVLLKH